jgi:hypothetical protein
MVDAPRLIPAAGFSSPSGAISGAAARIHPKNNKEKIMPSLRDAQDRAKRLAERQERARDAALAVEEYAAEQVAVLAKTARLRALRLAREAQEARAAAMKKTKRKA